MVESYAEETGRKLNQKPQVTPPAKLAVWGVVRYSIEHEGKVDLPSFPHLFPDTND